MDALVQVCHFALGFRRELPDFVCEQTTTSTQEAPPRVIPFDPKPMTVFKAQVTFAKGHERYSDITLNGKPLDPKSAAAATAEAMSFISSGELGSNLVDLFTPPVVAQFQFRRSATVHKVRASIYEFQIPANKNTFLGISDYRGVLLHPEYQGELWIASETGKLLRLDLRPVNLPSDFGFAKADTTIDYSVTTIADAGQFLLPSTSITDACTHIQRAYRCSQHTLTFRDCRKFGSKARIVP